MDCRVGVALRVGRPLIVLDVLLFFVSQVVGVSCQSFMHLCLLVQLRFLETLLGISAYLLNFRRLCFPHCRVSTQNEMAVFLDLRCVLPILKRQLVSLIFMDLKRILFLLLQQVLILLLMLFVDLLQNLVHFDQFFVIGSCCVRQFADLGECAALGTLLGAALCLDDLSLAQFLCSVKLLDVVGLGLVDFVLAYMRHWIVLGIVRIGLLVIICKRLN